MKKVHLIFFVLLLSLILGGCSNTAVNKIYNKSYNVEEITITDLENATVAAIEKASSSVIGVSNYQTVLLKEKLVGTGSGVIFECQALMQNDTIVSNCEETLNSNDVKQYNYLAVTNRHVIEGADRLKVYIGQEDSKINAELIQADDKVDLAVIKFSHYTYMQPIEFADSEKIQSGNFSIAIGNPSGYEFYNSSTFGIISFPRRYIADDTDNNNEVDWDAEYIQHDVAINPGNSGGALINLEGKLIGINTLKITSSEIENMGFAIPSNVVLEIINVLKTGAIPQRITLGITVIPVKTILNPEDYGDGFDNYVVPTDLKYGLYVVEVTEGKPAYNNLLSGDIILSVNNKDIYYSYEFRSEINKILKGENATFIILRNNQKIEINISF